MRIRNVLVIVSLRFSMHWLSQVQKKLNEEAFHINYSIKSERGKPSRLYVA